MKSDKMNRLLSHTLIFKISPINAFITWEVLNLGSNSSWFMYITYSYLYSIMNQVSYDTKVNIEVELTYSGKKFHDKFLLVNPSRNIKDVEIRRYDANKK